MHLTHAAKTLADSEAAPQKLWIATPDGGSGVLSMLSSLLIDSSRFAEG